MRMRVLNLIILFLLCFCTAVCSETIFIYIDKSCNDESSVICSSVKEGIFNELFELGHIVFDDIMQEENIDWESSDFTTLMRKADLGGAHFLFAIRVILNIFNMKKRTMSIEGFADYYCFDVRSCKLIGSGRIERNNFGKENDINQKTFGFMLGSDLSCELNMLWKKYIIKL